MPVKLLSVLLIGAVAAFPAAAQPGPFPTGTPAASRTINVSCPRNPDHAGGYEFSILCDVTARSPDGRYALTLGHDESDIVQLLDAGGRPIAAVPALGPGRFVLHWSPRSDAFFARYRADGARPARIRLFTVADNGPLEQTAFHDEAVRLTIAQFSCYSRAHPVSVDGAEWGRGGEKLRLSVEIRLDGCGTGEIMGRVRMAVDVAAGRIDPASVVVLYPRPPRQSRPRRGS